VTSFVANQEPDMKPRISPETCVDGPARDDSGDNSNEIDHSYDDEQAAMRFDRRRDVLVVRPLGQLDARTIERLAQIVARSITAVILDLAECVLSDPEALKNLDDAAPDDTELCIVSGRLSCRLLLARSGVAGRFPVFQREEDALQARLLAADGYGRGWSVP
jgi:hypothetical protein